MTGLLHEVRDDSWRKGSEGEQRVIRALIPTTLRLCFLFLISAAQIMPECAVGGWTLYHQHSLHEYATTSIARFAS